MTKKKVSSSKANSPKDQKLGEGTFPFIQSAPSNMPPADVEEVFEINENGEVMSHTIIDHTASVEGEDFAKPSIH